MSDILATMRAVLVADATVSGLVGTRLHALALPERSALPAITYYVVDTIPNETLTGIAGISRARIQVDSFADTIGGAVALADAVRLALQMKNHFINGTQYINDISLASGEAHRFERPDLGTAIRRFIVSMDFLVNY